jgi:integrase
MVVRQAFGEDRRGGRYIKETKTSQDNTIPLAPVAVEALKATRARQAADQLGAKPGTYYDQGLVFADGLGEPPDLNGISKVLTGLARAAGITGVTLHSCRHTVATQALALGSDVRTVSALLGHASPSTTLNLYGHVVAGAKRAAVGRVSDALE